MPSKNLFYYLYHPDPILVESRGDMGRILNRKLSDNFSELLQAYGMSIGVPVFPIRNYLSQKELKECYERYLEEVENAIRKSFTGVAFKVKIKVKKCIVNFGEKGIFEVGMALHPIFGVPYIPGSAIKGVFKRILYGILNSNEYSSIFSAKPFEEGKEKKQDAIAFSDALLDPSDPGEICLDVICPHVKPQSPLNELRNPNPIAFWILKGATLFFYIYPTESSEGRFRKDLLKTALQKLKRGSIVTIKEEKGEIVFFGIGAKTSSGYGYFEVERWEEL